MNEQEEEMIKKNEEMNKAKTELTLKMPEVISQVLDTYFKYFSTNPFIARLQVDSGVQYGQLNYVYNNHMQKQLVIAQEQKQLQPEVQS